MYLHIYMDTYTQTLIHKHTPVLFCLSAAWHRLHGLPKREGAEAARVGHCMYH